MVTVINSFLSLQEFLRGVVRNLPLGEYDCRLGLAKYSDYTHLEFPMNQHYHSDVIDSHIRDKLIHIGGNTNTALALADIYKYLFDPLYGNRNGFRKVWLQRLLLE